MAEITLQTNPKLVALDAALAEAKSREILCDNEVFRLKTVADFINRVTPHLKNPKVSNGMKALAQSAIDRMEADAGVEMMASQKANLVKYQVNLTSQKEWLIIELQRPEAEIVEDFKTWL